MTKTLTLLTMVAAAALAGCNKSDHNITGGGPADDQANVAVNNAAAPVALPPAILASKIYRCKDNSVVYIDWLADKKTADIKSEQGGPAIVLTAETEGGALTAEGYSLIGLPTAKTVTLTRPGIAQQACKA
jgi:hypothetical protein